MRASHVATALAAFTAGLTAASALHRRAGRPVAAPAPAVVPVPEAAAAEDVDAVVLPFVRPAVEQPAVQPSAQPAGPARCGDSGGLTKAGAPCGARATSGGRCHHHPLAA
ncbi:hypothetical protein JD79_00353 [Geodermatophilus normandii]|uniref:Uncharacterized protein n=1 Tax=Geodermatophilus normandii TaxID=1137989 RepID=A0A317QFY8_9ACTN|nr:hypothetical protein [Geodermatophilus normandii]PWW21225.1 hypothetical protein JD79_00353 [Geodermatophilus normandii]